MFISALPLILTNIVALVMVSVVLLSRSVSMKLRLSLIATIVSLIFWQNSIFIADNAATDLMLWNTLIFLWPTAAIGSCFIFIRNLHSHTRRDSHRSLPVYLSLLAVTIQLVPVLTFQVFTDVSRNGNELLLDRGGGYYVYLVGILFSLAVLITEVVVRRAKSERRTLERSALNVVLATVVIAGGYGLIINALVPLLIGGQELVGWGVLVVVIFVVGLGLSILHGRLLDVRFYAVRATAYILSLATLAVIYGLLVYAISAFFFDYNSSSEQSVINIVFALGLALVFQPVRQFFDRITNRIFYRGSYVSDEFFAELNRIIVSTTDLRNLLRQISRYMSTTFKSDQVFFVLHGKSGQPIVAGTEKHAKLPIADAVHIEAFLGQERRVIQASQLQNKVTMHRMLASHRIELVFALMQGEKFIGLLCLGDHRVASYTKRDLRVMTTVLDELTIAIQNALSVQAVRDLNANLEQRIDAATKELRASNAQLQRLDEAKDEFISMASHQLRTPLTSIKGYISMLMEGDAGKISPEQKHLLREAFVSSERMVRLIGDFLNVSRLQTGKFTLEKHPVNLAKLVGQEIEALEPNAAARGLKFEYKKPAHFPLLDLDENKIQQVVMNFSDNAIYYSREDSSIKVSLKKTHDTIEFTVKDSGIGVPADQQDELFTKFFRASNARKQRPDGTGVGLFLAKKVVVAHGGSMIFESKEGKGSTFGFRLPLEKLRVASDTDKLDNKPRNS